MRKIVWALSSVGVLSLLFCACAKRASINKTIDNPFQTITLEELKSQNLGSVQQNAQESEFILQTSRAELLEFEARTTDLPVPLLAELKKRYYNPYSEQQALYYQYKTTNFGSLLDFYTTQMERLGWQQIASMKGQEYIVVFDKPARFCILFIKQSNLKYSEFTIFIGTKTGS